MAKQNIEIIYKHYIPLEWIEEFESNFESNKIVANKIRNDDEISFFTGPEIADIIIFIKDNPETIILYPAVYDAFKFGLLKLIQNLKGLDLKKIKSYKTANSLRKEISIQYKNSKGDKIRLDIDGELSNEELIKVIDKTLKSLKKK